MLRQEKDVNVSPILMPCTKGERDRGGGSPPPPLPPNLQGSRRPGVVPPWLIFRDFQPQQ